MLPIVAAVVVLSVVSSLYITNVVKEEYIANSMKSMEYLSNQLAIDASALIDDNVNTAINLSNTMEAVTQEGSQTDAETIMNILVKFKQESARVYAAWVNWLPGQDGIEAEKAGMYMSEGHFAPMAIDGGGGKVRRAFTKGHNKTGKSGEWYNFALKENRIFISEPRRRIRKDKEVLGVTASVPMERDGKVVGVAGVIADITFIDKVVNEVKLYDTGYAFLLDYEFNAISHPNKELMGKSFKDAYAANRKASLERKASTARIFSPSNNKMSLYRFQPLELKVKGYKYVLTMVTVLPEEELLAFIPTLQVISFVSMLILVLVVSLIVYLVVRSVSRQLGGEPSDVIKVVNQVADGDFTQSIKTQTSDNSSLAFSVNKMAAGLREMLNELATSSNVLNDTGANLTNASKDLTSSTGRQSDSASQIAAASVEMTQTVQEIARNLTEMAEYVKSTADNANSGRATVSSSTQSVLKIKETVDESAKLVSSLDASSAQIRDIVNVISEIAEQTNLLALNAAIEAARAGEHGRGFAVVADEVRGLAERTQNATVEISDLVTGTQGEVEKVTASMEHVTENVDAGVTYSEQVNESLSVILDGIKSLQDMVDSVSSATTEMAATSKEIEGNINNVASVSEEVSEVASGVSDSSNELSSMSQSIKRLVDRFKI